MFCRDSFNYETLRKLIQYVGSSFHSRQCLVRNLDSVLRNIYGNTSTLFLLFFSPPPSANFHLLVGVISSLFLASQKLDCAKKDNRRDTKCNLDRNIRLPRFFCENERENWTLILIICVRPWSWFFL